VPVERLGLAPLIVRDVFRVIRTARGSGIPPVLLVEENVHAAVDVADRAHVPDDGRVVYEGPAAELGWTKSACSRLPVQAARTRPSHAAAGAFPLNRYWTVAVRPLKSGRLKRNPRRTLVGSRRSGRSCR
jgi:hypothetical protein